MPFASLFCQGFCHRARRWLWLCPTLLLAACATPPEPAEAPPQEPVVEQAPAPTRPFPPETLYALLVAEVAGSRGQFDVALGNYVQQAHTTRDPGVAARATRIAQFLGADQAALDSSLLWVELAPEDTEARLMATTELTKNGRLLEAFEHSRFLLENGSTPLFQTIAVHAAKATDTQRELLLDKYNELLTLNPDNLQLLVGRGLLLQQQGRLDAALASADQALAQDQDYIAAAILQARLLSELDRPEDALASLAGTLRRNPDNNRLRLQYARLLASSDLEKAYRQFEILLAEAPNSPELILSMALVAKELGRTDEARRYFEDLVVLGEHRSAAHYYLGQLEEDAENYHAALEHYLRVDRGPDYLPALLAATELQVRLGRADEAHQRLATLRQQQPDLAPRLYLLEAQVLLEHDRERQALDLLNQAVAANPMDTNLLYARAMLHDQRDDLAAAEADLRTIIKYDPANATALNALGYILTLRTERYEEALELIQRALSITPDDPAVIDSMGWVQYKLGNYTDALIRLRQAYAAMPDPEIAAHLGEVLWVLGEREEALAIWREGLALEPDSELIREAAERLGADLQE